MKQNIIIEIICFLLVLLFVYAAFSKLFNYGEFKSQLSSYPLLKESATAISILLPFTEIIIATMLMLNITRRTGMALSFIMMALFTAFIVYMLVFEKNLPCSCGGVLKQLTWKQHIAFNLIFLLMAFTGWMLERKNNNQEHIAY